MFLTKSTHGEWLYKSMDETMGPCESGAPAAVLDALSPTTSDYAAEWRRKCRDHSKLAQRRLAHGNVIRFAAPLHFPTGVRQTFRVVRERRPGARRAVTRFQCVDDDVMCRITGFSTLAWEIVARAWEGGE